MVQIVICEDGKQFGHIRAIVLLAALCFVIKWAVKNGMVEAYKKIEEKKTQHD